jgi:hypothetical protein
MKLKGTTLFGASVAMKAACFERVTQLVANKLKWTVQEHVVTVSFQQETSLNREQQNHDSE